MVMPKTLNISSSMFHENSRGRISSSSRVSGSGEGSASESRRESWEDVGSATRISSWLEGFTTGRGSMKEVFSRMRSKSAINSEVVL